MTRDRTPSCCDLDKLLSPEIFRALGDPNRVAIVCDLADSRGGPKTVGELAAELPVDLSVVSRHLGVLRDAGVLAAERTGRSVQYTIRATELVRLLRGLADAIEECCPAMARTGAEPASKPDTHGGGRRSRPAGGASD